jgi:hypothetical protein
VARQQLRHLQPVSVHAATVGLEAGRMHALAKQHTSSHDRLAHSGMRVREQDFGELHVDAPQRHDNVRNYC